jgi:hypothetical protein
MFAGDYPTDLFRDRIRMGEETAGIYRLCCAWLFFFRKAQWQCRYIVYFTKSSGLVMRRVRNAGLRFTGSWAELV